MTEFDPKTHNVTERRDFDDLKIGEVYRSPSRTVTDAHFAAFQMLSGDNHPIHYDIEFCKAHGLRGLLAHGFQVLAFSAVGAGTFPHMIGDKLIGFLEGAFIKEHANVVFSSYAMVKRAVRADKEVLLETRAIKNLAALRAFIEDIGGKLASVRST